MKHTEENTRGHNNTLVWEPPVGSFIQNIHPESLLRVSCWAVILCCVSYLPLWKPRTELLTFSPWPFLLFLTGNEARVAASCLNLCAFGSHLSCLPFSSLLSHLPHCPLAVLSPTQHGLLLGKLELCDALPHRASLWDSSPTVTRGQEGSGWASLPSHIMAVGKLPSVCSSHDAMPVSILNSFVFLWKWRKPSLNHRFIWKDMHH